MTRMMMKKRTRRRHWSRRSRNDTGRMESSGCVLARTLELEAEEEDAVLSFQPHHLLHTSHLLAFPEEEYSHKVDLLNFFSLPALDFLFARREAFVGKMGVVEVVWQVSDRDLVGGL